MSNEDNQVSEEEAEAVYNELDRKFGDSKTTVPSLIKAIIKTKDTTRVANLKEEELGLPQLPVRTYMELQLLCKDDMPEFANYFSEMKEIVTAPSLSREGFLVKQATVTRKEFADKTQRKENKGWFKKDKPPEQN